MTDDTVGHVHLSPHETAPSMALHHVQLAMPAGAEDAARTFYGGALGMAELAKPPALAARGGVWFS
jgi:catechol 2,3-dioxygenase-like lactoylglutathione lyase family enzyme